MEEQHEAAEQKFVGRVSDNPLAEEVRSTARRAHSPSGKREPEIMKKNPLTFLKQGRGRSQNQCSPDETAENPSDIGVQPALGDGAELEQPAMEVAQRAAGMFLAIQFT